MIPPSDDKVSCIVLAGGEGRRAGGADKGLIIYQGRPLIEHVIAAIKDQVDDIVISANRNIETYQRYSNTVIHDASDDYRGPLAGIAASLDHCKNQRILVVACDMPDLPADLVTRLNSTTPARAVHIATVNKYHQLALIVDRGQSDTIAQLIAQQKYKLIEWVESIPHNKIRFDDESETFNNLNHLEQNPRPKPSDRLKN